MSNIKKTSYEIDMTSGPLLKKILIFTLPILLTSLLQLLYNAADVIVIGVFSGEDSVAAITSTNVLTGLLVNLFMGMATGSGIIIAQEIGARNFEKLHKTVHTAMTLSLIIGVGSAIIGLVLTKNMLLWMKTPDDIIEKSALYMRIYFLGIPATMVYNFGAAIIRSSGDTRRPLMILSLSGIANVLLNVLFVTLFNMDVAGVAVATITSQYLSAIAIVRILLTDNAEYKLYLSDLKIHKKELLEVLRYGIPAGLQTSMFSFSNMIIQSSVNSFGSAVMAGNGAAASIDGFIFAAADSGAQASMTFSGQNFGAKKLKRVKSSMLYSILLSTVLGLLFGLVVLALKYPLLSIYVETPDAIAAGVSRLNTMCTIYFTCGIMNSIANTVRGMGKSVVPMIITMFFVCAFRVAWIYTVFPLSRTIETIFVSYPISYILAIFAHSTYFIIVYLKNKKKFKAQGITES